MYDDEPDDSREEFGIHFKEAQAIDGNENDGEEEGKANAFPSLNFTESFKTRNPNQQGERPEHPQPTRGRGARKLIFYSF